MNVMNDGDDDETMESEKNSLNLLISLGCNWYCNCQCLRCQQSNEQFGYCYMENDRENKFIHHFVH